MGGSVLRFLRGQRRAAPRAREPGATPPHGRSTVPRAASEPSLPRQHWSPPVQHQEHGPACRARPVRSDVTGSNPHPIRAPDTH
jgi:hypothetical protein